MFVEREEQLELLKALWRKPEGFCKEEDER